MKAHPQDFMDIMRTEVAKKDQISFMNQVGTIFGYLSASSLAEMEEPQSARERSAAIRKNSIDNLPFLLEEFENNAVRNGIEVLWAAGGAEACTLIRNIALRHDVRLITKGKSMISEEIDLNHYLQEQLGAEIYEGDLGELIVQLRGTPPFHIVGPAINLNVQEIAQTLVDGIGMEYTEDATEIAGQVRKFMRRQFEKADMGITGVNMAVASTGSIILAENEGNIRWSTAAPRVHIALMSLEKVVADLSEGFYLMEMLSRSCTGQGMTSYVSVLSGPRGEGERDGPEKMYVVILDNGRSKIYQDEGLRQALQCIRCGRCGTACPVYLAVGAYPYGWCYPGPMGTVLSPLLLGLEATRDLYEACTLCGGCEAVCPAGIHHVELFHRYRAMQAQGDQTYQGGKGSMMDRNAFKGWAAAVKRPALFNKSVDMIRYFLGKGEDGYIGKMHGPLKAWSGYRDMPIAKRTFHQYWAEMKMNTKPDGEAESVRDEQEGGQHE
ncbi:MAG TPA: lactate utilization protein B [Syntrophomonas sp.]|nr:lactate utilization protein B [Syntrophomonas sp.]